MTHGTVKIRWQAEDGYVTGARPKYTTIHLSELEDCETEGQVEEEIDRRVEEDFQQQVTYFIEQDSVQAALQHWRELKGKGQEE